MKIIKLNQVAEVTLWVWKEEDPYIKQIDIYSTEWELLYSFDSMDKNIDDKIKNLFYLS